MLNQLPQLKRITLELGNCRVESMSKDYLNKLKQLESLEIIGGTINNVPDNTFAGCVRLSNLKLSHTGLTRLTNGVFNNCDLLVSLDLSHNNIQTIDDDVFVHCTSLRHCDLSFNSLTTLPVAIFHFNREMWDLLAQVPGQRTSVMSGYVSLASLKLAGCFDLSDYQLERGGVYNLIKKTDSQGQPITKVPLPSTRDAIEKAARAEAMSSASTTGGIGEMARLRCLELARGAEMTVAATVPIKDRRDSLGDLIKQLALCLADHEIYHFAKEYIQRQLKAYRVS